MLMLQQELPKDFIMVFQVSLNFDPVKETLKI